MDTVLDWLKLNSLEMYEPLAWKVFSIEQDEGKTIKLLQLFIVLVKRTHYGKAN